MSWRYHVLAFAEVLGRYVFSLFPKLRQWIYRRVRKPQAQSEAVSLDELERMIRQLGVEEGDVLMVHSSWDGMRALQAPPFDVIKMLLQLVGDTGTLMMTTAPVFTYREDIPVYNVAKSPSARGLLTEIFRRLPNALRSPCPMGTVSAVGPLAETMTCDFREESGGKPHGYGSPYWELIQQQGKALVLGIDVIRTLTLMHCAVEVLGDELPIPHFFGPLPFIVIQNGQEQRWTVYRQRRKWDNHYASATFAKMIAASGTCQETSLKGLKVAVVDAKAFFDWHLPLARQQGWPFWRFPRKKR